jgi:hypothetical protein
MEPLTETVELDIDESNELAFKIKLEGAATSPAKVRLVCEGSDFSYMFSGYGTSEPEVVQFTLPQMSSKIQEGTYSARIEVLVENRYFAPLQFQINFKKTLSVVAESVSIVSRPAKPDIKVTAAPLIAARPQVALSTIKFEQRPEPRPKPSRQIPAAEPVKTPVASPNASSSSLREAYLKKMSTENVPESEAETLRKKAREILRSKLGK